MPGASSLPWRRSTDVILIMVSVCVIMCQSLLLLFWSIITCILSACCILLLPQCLRIYSPVIPHHSGSWWASPSEPTLVSGSLERGSTGGHTFSVPCPSARVMTPTSKTSLLLHVVSFPLSSTYSCAFILTTFPNLSS